MADQAYPGPARMGTVHHLRRADPERFYRAPVTPPLPFIERPQTAEEVLGDVLAELGRLGATEDEAVRYVTVTLRRAQMRGRFELCAHPDREHDHPTCLASQDGLRTYGLPVLG